MKMDRRPRISDDGFQESDFLRVRRMFWRLTYLLCMECASVLVGFLRKEGGGGAVAEG